MDIFAVGCVLAELFMDGKKLFNYSDLNRYRRSEFSLSDAVHTVPVAIQPLIAAMLSLDPEKRPTVQESLQSWQQSIFPACFSRVIFPLLSPVVSTSVGKSDSDEIVNIVTENSQHIWNYLLRQSFWVQYETGERRSAESGLDAGLSDPRSILIIIDLVCSHIRFLKKPKWKSIALDMLLSFSPYVEDEAKLHRILPYLIATLSDTSEKGAIIAKALRAIVSILQEVRSLAMYEVVLFEDYILTALLSLRQSESLYVKYTFLQLVPEIVRLGKKFINLSLYRLRKMQVSVAGSYDYRFSEMYTKVFAVLRDQYLHSEKDLHWVILQAIAEIPAIAGWDFASTFIAKLHTECRNSPSIDKDISFVLSSCLSPCAPDTIHSLAFFIAEKGLFSNDEIFMWNSLLILARINLRNNELSNILMRTRSLFLHPNAWLRDLYVEIILACVGKFSLAENYAYLAPFVRDFVGVREKVYLVTEELVRGGMMKPLLRRVLSANIETTAGYTQGSLQVVADFMHVSESIGGRFPQGSVSRPSLQTDKPPTYSFDKPSTVEPSSETVLLHSVSMSTRNTFSEDFITGRFSERVSHAKKVPSRGSQDFARPFFSSESHPLKFSLSHVLTEHTDPVVCIVPFDASPNLFLTLTTKGEAKLWNFVSILNPEFAGIRSVKTEKVDCKRARAAVAFGNSNSALIALEDFRANPFDTPKHGLKVCCLVEYSIEEFYPLREDFGPALSLQTLVGDKVFAYTTQSGVIAIGDLRTDSPPLVCEFGSQMGLFTTSVMGEEGQSIICGSTSGYVLVYDVRFNAIGRVLMYSKKGCITSIAQWRPEQSHCFERHVQSKSDPHIALACGSGDTDVSLLNLSTGRSVCYLTANTTSPSVPYLLPDDSNSLLAPAHTPPKSINEIYCAHSFSSVQSYTQRSQSLTKLLAHTGLTQSLGQSAINLKRMFESRATIAKVVTMPAGPMAGNVVTGGFDAKIRHWDLQTPKNSRDFDGSPSVYYNQQLGDSHVIVEQSAGQTASGPPSALRISDMSEGGAGWRERHSGDILDLKLGRGDGSGLLLSSGRDGSVRVWR